MPQVFCFGDSITYGAWDIQQSGWVARLRKYLDEKAEEDPTMYCLTYNLGIPGDTTEGLRKRFLHETQVRFDRKKKEKPLFIFAFGGNDAYVIPEHNSFNVPKEAYADNLRYVLDQAKEFSDNIVVLTTTPLNEGLTSHARKIRLNSYVKEYNEVVTQVCNEKGVHTIDVYDAFMTVDHTQLLDDEDGLHPNSEGHRLIFECVKKHLEETVFSHNHSQ
jgi:lysophospholipase L1-like esterase